MGDSFPEKSLMPWIVLSEESLTLFRDPSDVTGRAADYIPAVDWLEDDFRMTLVTLNLYLWCQESARTRVAWLAI